MSNARKATIIHFMVCALVTFITVQCAPLKLQFPDYQFDLKTANSIIPTVFSTNCNDFQKFWYIRNGVISNDTQNTNHCIKVINPLHSAMNNGLYRNEVYEHFVYYSTTPNDTNDNSTTITQQNGQESNATINIVKNKEYLTYHLLVYNTSQYCDWYCWFNKLVSHFSSFLNSTNYSQMNVYNQILISSEIAFFVPMEDDNCGYCQRWMDANSFIDKQCGVAVELNVWPKEWANENQTALLTYSSNLDSISIYDTVKSFNPFNQFIFFFLVQAQGYK